MALFKKMEADFTSNNTDSGGEIEYVRCLILGSGPAGYTAAIYAARANLQPVLYQGLEPGGQLTTTTEVENFPGYPEGVTGPLMMADMQKQAARFQVDIRMGMATAVDLSGQKHKVIIDNNKTIITDVLIIATGATAKYLGLASEQRLRGSGVSACATCDGFFYKNKPVAVVGGGDTACEEALYLAGICSKVYLVVRKNFLRASKVMQERVMKNRKIEILFEHVTKEINGSQVVEGMTLIKQGREEVKITVDGVFIAIGHQPNTAIFKDYVTLDEAGYIITQGSSTRTNVPGVFACGDVMDPIYRQAITAAGSGCKAAIDAERYLAEKGV